jgi:hypothetical protein
MKQDKMKGKYDAVISLGAACQVAWQLKRKGLRNFSGPFDWFILESLSRVTDLFHNRFSHFMDLSQLKIEGTHKDCLKVRDTVYNCLSVHDFPLSRNSAEHLGSYTEFRAKIDRRVNRLQTMLEDSHRSILFVRMYGKLADRHCYNYMVDEFKALHATLRQTMPGSFSILAVTETTDPEFLDQDWGLDNLYQAQAAPSDDHWEGCNRSWDKILAGVKLKKHWF